jgi:hypothetical protein
VSGTARKLVLAVLLLGISAALVVYILGGPRWQSLAMAGFLIVIWTPIKGLIYRRLGGARPYQSALAANASSELIGLPFHLGLAFWPSIGVSFVVSAAIETLALLVMGTASSLKRALFLSYYAGFVAHVITAGFFRAQRDLGVGVAILAVGIALVHLPTFFPDEWAEEPPSTRI